MKRHWSYLKYVLRHKWFVLLSGIKTGTPLWRLIIHDWTKFLPCEWVPYVHTFYNRDGSKRDWKTRDQWDKLEFDRAWNHHQKANDHHWQYWLLTNDSDDPKHQPLLMPARCWSEMVADWMGAGRAITGRWDFFAWYQSNKEKIMLNEHTRERVESLLRDMEDRRLREEL